jgi:triosephosphate isomerase
MPASVRRPLIVGNWKMHKTASEAAVFVQRLTELLPASDRVEVAVAPPFTALSAAAQVLGTTSRILLAAQNLHWEDHGPFTGEISAPMLKDLGCRFVILGHSERRQHFGERDDGINKKVRAALRHGLQPILCVGETLAEREADRTEQIVSGQLQAGLRGVSKEEIVLVTIAYEPVWAIGTGRAATAPQAVAVHQLLRGSLHRWGEDTADGIRILYGGSVTAENAGEFLAHPEIDGALVGGACLQLESFARIVSHAQTATGSRS